MKIFNNIVVISALIISACCSCSKAEPSVSEEQIPVSYTISLLDTKAVSANGAAINKVWCGLYNPDGTMATNYAPVDFVNGSARCEVVMLRGHSYKLVFLAQYYKDSVTPTYPINPQTATVGLPETLVANSDEYDLFYGVDEIVAYNGTPNGSIALDRVVAMVNFISSDEDWNSAVAQGAVPTHSSIEVTGVSAGFDLLEGKPKADKANLQFAKSEIPEAKHLGAVFCIAEGKIGATINLYTSAEQDATPLKTVALTDVQVEANRKTNIVGGVIGSQGAIL